MHDVDDTSLHDLDVRLVRVETRVDSIAKSEASLTKRMEEVMTTLAGIAGEQRATRWLLGIGLTATTVILLAAQLLLR
jgi:hypothetical protein